MSNPLDLIALTDATAALQSAGVALGAGQGAWLPSAIAAASLAVQRYCQRFFPLANYDEVRQPQAGQWDRNEPDTVLLRYPPIASIARVSSGRTTALTILNLDNASNQRATVSLLWTGDPIVQQTATGILLSRQASGTAISATLAFADLATVGSLADAINGLGGGWSANVGAGLANVATLDAGGAFSELFGPNGPQGALLGTSEGARLDVFRVDVQSWDYDSSNGVLFLSPQAGASLAGPGSPQLWGVTDPLDGLVAGGGQWRAAVRVIYQGGFASIPLAVQQATAEVVKAMLERLATDTTIASESVGAHSLSAFAAESLATIPAAARQALAPYRIYRA
jgi:hypothetical protein